MSIFDHYLSRYASTREEEYTLEEYLSLCGDEPSTYATSAERLLEAIGEPEKVDTREDPGLSRIFSNKVIMRYPAFAEFFGMEETIQQIVSFFRHAAQGLEEKKQILYLLGPVGGGKSSLAEKLKELMEQRPFYAIKGSPVNESPLGLFSRGEDGPVLEDNYGIPRRYLSGIMSPWAGKRLQEFNGDITKFKVARLKPSALHQVAVAKTEPGDENNQDISSLVGKVDIRMLERYAQDDPDAYAFSGGLCHANQGLLEFVEMFKAPIKVLHPLLTATQEGNYKGTEGLGAIPFEGIILAHSNEAEWQTFKTNRNNEAFIDRVYIVKVPYCLRVSEEVKIYEKLLKNSSLSHAACAPGTLEMMSRFGVLSRLKEPENSEHRVQDADLRRRKSEGRGSKSESRYTSTVITPGVDEGMTGLSTRFSFKILSRVFNYDHAEVAANPVHLLHVLEQPGGTGAIPQRAGGALPLVHQGHSCLQLCRSLSAKRSRPPTSNLIRSTAKTYSIVMSPMRTTGSRMKSIAIPTPARSFDRAALNEELEKIEKASRDQQPQRFPPRDRQLRAEGSGPKRREKPRLDQLREAA